MYQNVKTLTFIFVCAVAVASLLLFSPVLSAQSSDPKMDKSLDWHGWLHEEPPETAEEIAEYKKMRLAQHYEKHGNPQPEDAIRIDSIRELSTYAEKDNVHVKMEPGTYRITTDNAPDLSGWVQGPHGHKRAMLLHFSGDNSYWDLRDVTIETETRVMGQFDAARGTGPYAHLPEGIHTMDEVYLTGKDSILRGMDYENVHNDEWSVEESTAESMRVFNIEGERNLIHNVSITSRTSWPYGYSSWLGKGGPSYARIRKKGCIAGGGYKNLHVGMEAHARSYGHALGFRSIRNLEFIDCVIDGEIRNTNEIYEEKSGRAYELLKENDFKKAGQDFRLPRNTMISCQEGCFRTYGNNAVLKILGCRISGTRSGTGLAGTGNHTRIYIAGSGFRHFEHKGITPAPNTTIRTCAAGFRYSPAVMIGRYGHTSIKNVDAEVTLLPSETPDSVKQQMYSYQELPNANPWPFVAASISGKGHRVVLKQDAEDLGKPNAPIVVGFQKFAEEPARDITLINYTDQPVILRESAKNCIVKSKAPVEDRGKNNEVSRLE